MQSILSILRTFAPWIMGVGLAITVGAGLFMVSSTAAASRDLAMGIGVAGAVVYLTGRIGLAMQRREKSGRRVDQPVDTDEEA